MKQDNSNILAVLSAKKMEYSTDDTRELTIHFLELNARTNHYSGMTFGENPLAMLQIRAYVGNDGEFGIKTEYRDMYSVGLSDAVFMLKTLECVEKGVKRYTEKYGYIHTFAQYGAVVLDILNVSQIAVISHNARTWTDTEFRNFDIKDLAFYVKGQLEKIN